LTNPKRLINLLKAETEADRPIINTLVVSVPAGVLGAMIGVRMEGAKPVVFGLSLFGVVGVWSGTAFYLLKYKVLRIVAEIANAPKVTTRLLSPDFRKLESETTGRRLFIPGVGSANQQQSAVEDLTKVARGLASGKTLAFKHWVPKRRGFSEAEYTAMQDSLIEWKLAERGARDSLALTRNGEAVMRYLANHTPTEDFLMSIPVS